MPAGNRIAYVGCRTTRERNARGDGLCVYHLPSGGAEPWERTQCVDGLINPSFLAIDHGACTLYTVHGDSSEVSAFRIDPRDGSLSFLNQVSCRGQNPVHLVIDALGQHLVVANHVASGDYRPSLAVIALAADGSLGDLVDHLVLEGVPGPHRIEQPFAKPHQVVFDPTGRFLAVPDKGLDVVHTYAFTEGRLGAVEAPSMQAREGAGPRHLAFHPERPLAFVLNELSSTILACRYDREAGAIEPIQEASSLPDSFIGFSRAAEIELSPDGRFVYASNRGLDTIGAFAIDQETGRLSPVGWYPTLGRTPRFFALDPVGDKLYVANEESDTIISFERDRSSGALSTPYCVAETGSPTCIVITEVSTQ